MKKRIVTLSLIVALAATAIIGGTMAYFTDTKEATNTFTVGKVGIKLDETDVDVYGVKDGENRVTENSYKLIPGHEYIKDPMVTVLADSEESYVRMVVTVSNVDLLKSAFKDDVAANDVFLLQNFVNWNSDNWLLESATANGRYEFRYKEAVTTVGVADLELAPLFTTITIPETATNDTLAKITSNVEIKIEAHAIQTDGFEPDGTKTAEDVAWEAFDAQ